MVHSFVRPTHAMPCFKEQDQSAKNYKEITHTILQNRTAFELTLPQSLREDELADAIFCFFLLPFNFSPAKTTSLASFRHSGQYLKSPVSEN